MRSSQLLVLLIYSELVPVLVPLLSVLQPGGLNTRKFSNACHEFMADLVCMYVCMYVCTLSRVYDADVVCQLRLRLRLRLIYYGKINRQGDAAQGTRLLSRGLTLLAESSRSHTRSRSRVIY